ncbi:exodeoxyribonuclease V gamma subunit [Filimonas zeae]|uniref:RecBCD enzyme subunit RecC n=1 Tax=Filimonas zeae TaxID=1737353 RepID=A0A917IQC0_9BACT|nr:exodeoxyribonuclease V subunit gamma [Filimonas zeae]MDR6337642.1 exodeoxyribonuclease V gamma subunit [Filimonas zeae]GGH59603.1 RecBCD enzyme subunit RecC [Filimonas zeae]
MALFVKVSNSLERLSQQLSHTLQQSQTGVFEPYTIVTQTEGMNNWLRQQLAAQMGIAANCRFVKPNDLIYNVYYLLGGSHSEILSAQTLSWLLYNLLGEPDFARRFPAIAGYFTTGADREVKRMALAEKVADLFDQYQIYRPEMIMQWNQSDVKIAEEDAWQQYLWVNAKQASNHTLPDKTVVGQYILEALQNVAQQKTLRHRMKAVHLFGLSIITAYHMHILLKLSEVTDVHFHMINPAPTVYWLDDRSEKQLARWRQKGRFTEAEITGNPLLNSWGTVVKDTFSMFFTHDAFINAYDDADIVPPVPDSLLHKLQHDIFNAAAGEARNVLTAGDIQDGSLTINSCYTVAREVEALYNYLVYLADQKEKNLSPRDIVVMVSDINVYAPYIKAVFANAPYRFRYTIADESYADNDSLLNALYAVLQLSEESCTAEDVVQLLDSSYVRKRFAISDPMLIRQVVTQANIRYGIEGRETDETFLVSWRYGLKRILFGICMSGEEEYGEGTYSFYPVDRMEGREAQEIIRFCHFVEMLIQVVEDKKRSRSVAGWVSYIEFVLHNLVYEAQEEAEEEYVQVIQQLTAYNLVNEYMRDNISYAVFSHSFLQTLGSTTRSGLFVNGGITFCSLIPMRSIPFKVVAVLGMGYNQFPRREQTVHFNLMEKNRQRGDRNIKENDKHLLLETVLSAREYLYISYIGQSAKDNTTVPASALIDELVEYIESGAEEPEKVKQQLITLQPLQSFSIRYNRQNTRLYNYLTMAPAEKKVMTVADKAIAEISFEEIMLDDLVYFFRHPFRVYYNKVLGIYYRNEQVLLKENELFTLNTLQQWTLKNKLLQLPEGEQEQLKKRLVKTGGLPLKNMADVQWQQLNETVAQTRSLYRNCTKGAGEQKVDILLPCSGGSVLKGTISEVFDGTLVQVSWSKNERKYLMDAYIRYLAGIAAGVLNGMCFISGAKENKVFEAAPLAKEEAMQRLNQLVEVYRSGFTRIVPFYPDFAISPHELETLDEPGFHKKVKDALDNGFFERKDDPYLMPEYDKGFFHSPGIMEEYKTIARLLIAPLASVFPGYPFK